MAKQEKRFWSVVGLLILVFGFGFFGAWVGNEYADINNTVIQEGEKEVIERVEQVSYVEESALIDGVEKISPAVVSIVVTKDLPMYRQEMSPFFGDPFFGDPFGFRFGEPSRPEGNEEEQPSIKQNVGGGSGFIVTNDGLIVTNKHVVSDRDADYTIVLSDGVEYASEVVAMDTVLDVAILQMLDEEGEKPSGLPVVEMGSSEDLKIGQRVFAVGYALAEYANTVTSGVISAKERDVTAGGLGGAERISGLIQTDTAINPGNSGGPLANLAGQVVGINTAIAGGAEGIGFVIPIDEVKPIIESVLEHGRIMRPYIGVLYQMITPAIAEQLDLEITEGARLVEDMQRGIPAVAPESPAKDAGLKVGDVITKLNGKELTVKNDLRSAILEYSPGESITLTVWRDGEELEKELTLAESPLTKPDEE